MFLVVNIYFNPQVVTYIGVFKPTLYKSIQENNTNTSLSMTILTAEYSDLSIPLGCIVAGCRTWTAELRNRDIITKEETNKVKSKR